MRAIDEKIGVSVLRGVLLHRSRPQEAHAIAVENRKKLKRAIADRHHCQPQRSYHVAILKRQSLGHGELSRKLKSQADRKAGERGGAG